VQTNEDHDILSFVDKNVVVVIVVTVIRKEKNETENNKKNNHAGILYIIFVHVVGF
jgi:hypothetical protein